MGCVARKILTGFACLPSCRREEGWKGSCEGNKWSSKKLLNVSLALCFDKVTP